MSKHTSPLVIYHNPRCSKSREALKLIEDRGLHPQVVEYLKTPPTAEELDQILRMLKLEPRDLMRRKEPEYADADLDDPGLTRETLIRAMVQRPKLIERPIVIHGEKAALGRPPEQILEIL